MADKPKPSQEEIEQFLKLFKANWDGSLVPRADPKNDETLEILGITPKQRAEEVRKLHYYNYFKGPSLDHDGSPGKEWWGFGLKVKGREIYIKICVVKKGDGGDRGRCMSFHISRWPIIYPFKKRG